MKIILNTVIDIKNKLIGQRDSIFLSKSGSLEDEKAIPIDDDIAPAIKFNTINAPKDERILCLLDICPIDIEA